MHYHHHYCCAPLRSCFSVCWLCVLWWWWRHRRGKPPHTGVVFSFYYFFPLEVISRTHTHTHNEKRRTPKLCVCVCWLKKTRKDHEESWLLVRVRVWLCPMQTISLTHTHCCYYFISIENYYELLYIWLHVWMFVHWLRWKCQDLQCWSMKSFIVHFLAYNQF